MSLLDLFKKKPAPVNDAALERQELDNFLWSCERMFFHEDRYLLTRTQKIHLVHLLADLGRETETNPNRLRIYDFFRTLYQFTRHDYETYLDGTDATAIVTSMAELRMQAKEALVLIMHAMLHTGATATPQQTALVEGLFHAIGITKADHQRIVASHSLPAHTRKDIL